jgi:plasmid stabilization system protein ParE
LRQEVVDKDLAGVSDAAVRVALRRVGDNPEVGKPLGGKLRGCRSVRLEGENRVVYRVIEMGGRQAVEVLAIDRRRANSAYATAEKRV